MTKRRRGGVRTNEQRLRCHVRIISYHFECEDCDMKWKKSYTEDPGESFARSQIKHRCSRKKRQA